MMDTQSVKLFINIEIEGRKHEISLNQFEDADKIAHHFVRNNQLDINLVESLAEHIKGFLKRFEKRVEVKKNFERNFQAYSDNETYNYEHDMMDSDPNITQVEQSEFLNDDSFVFDYKKKEEGGSKSVKLDSKKRGKSVKSSYARIHEGKRKTLSKNKQMMSNTGNYPRKTKEYPFNTDKKGKRLVPVCDDNRKTMKLSNFSNLKNGKISDNKRLKAMVEAQKTKEREDNSMQYDKDDIETKNFYRPTVTYINKLLAEHSKDGTIDIDLIKKHYEKFIDVENNDFLNTLQVEKEQTDAQKGAKMDIEKFNKRFYYNQIKQKQKKEQYMEEIRVMKELEKKKVTYSFKPQINPISEKMYKENEESELKIEERLIKKGKEAQSRKLDMEIAEKWKRDNQFDFKPKINPQSIEIINQKNTESEEMIQPRYNELYNSAIEKQNKRLCKEDREHTLQFTTNDKSNHIFFNSDIPKDFHQRQEFMELKKLYNKTRAEESNKLTFTPELVSKQIDFDDSLQDIPIGTRLFLNSKNKRKTHDLDESKERVQEKNLTSEKINKQRKQRISKNLFEMLDTDYDDLLIMSQLTTKRVPEEVLVIIKKLLDGISLYYKEIDYKQFHELFSVYYDGLISVDKQKLLQKKDKPLFDDSKLFRPKLNKKSMKMAELIRKKTKKSN